jgi:hypothetical protein
MDEMSFSDIAIVSCGTMSPELNHLKKDGFLDYCDWMGIPMQAYLVRLDRFKRLLIEGVQNLAP